MTNLEDLMKAIQKSLYQAENPMHDVSYYENFYYKGLIKAYKECLDLIKFYLET